MKIELIYEKNCPNVDDTRKTLKEALTICGCSLHWIEWEQSDPKSPKYIKNYGSPTILINGKDIITNQISSSQCCRIYEKDGHLQGVPNVEKVIDAIRQNRQTYFTLLSNLTIIPALGLSLLPLSLCPACWPVYGGLLSVLGVGVLLEADYFLPVMIMFFASSIVFLFYQAKDRQGIGPGILGLISACVIFAGKFWIQINVVSYFGIILLLFASIWNIFPSNMAYQNISNNYVIGTSIKERR